MNEKDEINSKNIIKFANPHAKKDKKNVKIVKDFNGFDYVETDKDLNGKSFTKSTLLGYAKECSYVVRLMREKNKKIYLYDYEVPQDRLCEFLKGVETGEIDGILIEVERFIPKGLA